MTPWELKGRELANCTCEYGCNCQFGGTPDKGHCYAVAAIVIDEGHFGDARLDGLRIAGIYKWPGAIHEGNGQAVAFVDARADAAQRDGLLRIMSGQDTQPFATMFAVFASTVSKMHDPVFTSLEIDIDVDRRAGRVIVPNHIDMLARPIRNAATGGEVRAQIVLPDGFEYEVAEVASGSTRTGAPLVVDIQDKYAQFARLHMNNDGLIRSRPAA
ncbi:MAG TPA: DUF1326 domain-containing protein [Caulobacteraceae bacterium]|jgi:hypothetical protein|nr:DUF1326 domain-containing protein [Caulobacteraceae bacterium]